MRLSDATSTLHLLSAYGVAVSNDPAVSSSSLRATGWRPSAAHWGGGMSVVLRRGSTCPLSRAMDGCIPRRGTTSPCQSVATSKIVKRCCSWVFSWKQRYQVSRPLPFLRLPLGKVGGQRGLSPRRVGGGWCTCFCCQSFVHRSTELLSVAYSGVSQQRGKLRCWLL